MARPRIIIADTDVNYIIPLQLKFVEDFFEKVDLEIITDEGYFDELFSSPQRADILVVSEDLYNQSLQRHNIANIFLMTEQYEEDQTDELNLNRIFKYTSIKEIFNEIIGKSADVLNIQFEGKQDTQIVVVYAAAGGVGKTTVALGISDSLTMNYKRVLYINASHLQSFQRILDNASSITSTDVYAKLSNANENIYSEIKHVIRKEGFSYLPPFKAALMSLGLKYAIYKQIAIAAKKSGEYDFVIIDADTDFNEDKADLINIADKVIIVTNQKESSVVASNVLVSNINGSNSEKYIFVCNNFDKDDDNALISPRVSMKFTVNDYIEHFDHYDQMKCSDFAKNSGIQKVAFLVM